MTFKDAFRCSSQIVPPARVYVDVSSTLEDPVFYVAEALERLVEEAHSPQGFSAAQMKWFVGFLWQNGFDSMIDLMGYGDFEKWDGNPSVFGWNLKNGVYQPCFPGFLCEKELILAGREAHYRRSFPSLESYFRAPFIGIDGNSR